MKWNAKGILAAPKYSTVYMGRKSIRTSGPKGVSSGNANHAWLWFCKSGSYNLDPRIYWA